MEAQSKQVLEQHCWLLAGNSDHKIGPNALGTRSAMRTVLALYPESFPSVSITPCFSYNQEMERSQLILRRWNGGNWDWVVGPSLTLE